MRQLFRKEYAKELEETQIALDAEPSAFHVPMSNRTSSSRSRRRPIRMSISSMGR